MYFAIHIAFAEAILGSHGNLEGSRATLTRWRGANLVPVGTVIGSRRVWLASHVAVLTLPKSIIEVNGVAVASL